MAFAAVRRRARRTSWCSKSGWAAVSTPPTSCTPELCVITPVDFDHEAFLGKSLECDRRREGRHPEAGRARRLRAAAAGSRARCWKRAPASTRDWTDSTGPSAISELDARGSRFDVGGICTSTARWPASTRWRTPSPPRSRSCAWACPAPRSSAASPRRAGRAAWSASPSNPEIILDGAHNPAGARALAAYIERFYSDRRVRLIYGAMRDKASRRSPAFCFRSRSR